MSDAISVVIPVRDGERYLGPAITSLIDQTRPPEEIIVVDDGSSDGSAELARSYPGVTVYSTPPRSPGLARNLGAQYARCGLLAFLDADDLATPRRLELQAAELSRRPDLDAVVGRMEAFISEDCDPRIREQLAVPVGAPVTYVTGTLMLRREAFIASGGFAEELRYGEMVDWFARMRGTLAFGSVDHVVLRRRIHGGNRSLQHLGHHASILAVARRAVLRAAEEEA